MDKKLIILLSTFGVLILGVVVYGFSNYIGEISAKENYVNMERMKDNGFNIINSEGERDFVGHVDFDEKDRQVPLEKYLSTTEKEFIEDVEGLPMLSKTDKSVDDSINEYANILLGDEINCDLDEPDYGDTFQGCFSRTSVLLENSNEDYLDYVNNGLNTMEENIDRKMEIIGEIKFKLKDGDKDVRLTLDYMYKLNGTYKENISDLKDLTNNVGGFTMDEMSSELVGINNAYQTNDPQFELRLLRYLNEYKNT